MNRTREFIAAIAISTQLLLPAAVLAAEEETAERTEASQTGGSSQRAKTGVGGAASPAARQALAGSSSFLSTGLLVGTATFGVVLAIALKTATDRDKLGDGGGSTTTTTTTTTTTSSGN